MSPRKYVLLDVFTDQLFGGNQLAVFPDGAGLSSSVMQAIARELNLSETVFILPPPAGADASLRIFTPAMELPFAGHPTIGAALALALDDGPFADRDNLLFAEQAGAVPVTLSARGDRRFATLTSPQLPLRLSTRLDAEAASSILGVDFADLVPSGLAAYSAGVPFSFLPLRSIELLNSVKFNATAWQANAASTSAPHIVAYALDARNAGRDIHVRMFAPLMGISEDPATGAAAAALAGLLVDHRTLDDGTHRWAIHQGHAMGRPSLINLEADVESGRAKAVRVGGTAVVVGHGSLRIDVAPA